MGIFVCVCVSVSLFVCGCVKMGVYMSEIIFCKLLIRVIFQVRVGMRSLEKNETFLVFVFYQFFFFLDVKLS